MTENNNRQAYIPEGAIPVKNPNGSAPSFIVENPGSVVFSLPGVPFEMKWLFDNELVPYLRRKFNLTEAIYSRVLKIADLGESAVDDRVGHLIANSTNPMVGVLAHPGQVDVRIAAKAAGAEEAMRLIGPMEEEVRGLLGQHYRQASAHRMTGENTARDRKVLEHCLAVCRHLAGIESVGAEGRRPVAPLVEQNDAVAFFDQLFSYQVKTSKVVENPVGQNHRRTIAS